MMMRMTYFTLSDDDDNFTLPDDYDNDYFTLSDDYDYNDYFTLPDDDLFYAAC